MDDKLRYICKVSQIAQKWNRALCEVLIITLQIFQTALNKTPDVLSYFKAAENSNSFNLNAEIAKKIAALLHDFINLKLSNQAENL
ncbi:hypothetical protein T08_3522 [Trichinella sp. T8]|nr:hypothetical protein T08_3522 [Trichinella sp. T8]